MTLIEGTASLVLRHTSGDAFDVAGGIVRTFGSNLYKEQRTRNQTLHSGTEEVQGCKKRNECVSEKKSDGDDPTS